jgi:hypothetical protein
MVVIALCAVVFGRAMAQALPGSRSGLGRWLEVNNWLAAFCTQLLAVWVVTIGGRLALLTSLDQRLDNRHRILVAPAASVVLFLVVFASLDFVIGPFSPEISLILGIAGACAALGASAACARPAHVRVGAIVLPLIAAASLAQVMARLLAMQAGDAALPRQYLVSRWVATIAALLDTGSLVIAAIWIARRDRLRRIWVSVAVGLALLLGLAAQHGATPRANFSEVLLSRLLAQLHREPSALLPRVFQDTQEVFALVVATWLLLRPRSAPAELRSCLAMVLLARCSPDIPLCAGLLVTGALGLLAMATHSPQLAREHSGVADKPHLVQADR